MPTPQDEIDLLKNEYLASENLDLLKEDLAFAVAHRVVKYNDPNLLTHMPSWVEDMVRQMCADYQRSGAYMVASSLGVTDHSDMVKKLTVLLPIRKPE